MSCYPEVSNEKLFRSRVLEQADTAKRRRIHASIVSEQQRGEILGNIQVLRFQISVNNLL